MRGPLISLLFMLVFNSVVFAGGISGGGGNVINPTPPRYLEDPDIVIRAINKAFKTLPSFLRKMESKYKSNQMEIRQKSIYDLIFDGSPNIFDMMKSRTLYVEEDMPCKNSFGVDYDGSIIAPKPYSVCISAFNLSRKVDGSEIHLQASALLAHEYTEVMGLDDEQAIMVQAEVLSDMRKMFYSY